MAKSIYFEYLTSVSELLAMLIFSFIITLEIKELRLCQLNTIDLIYVFAAFFQPYRHFNSCLTVTGYGCWYLSILFILLTFTLLKSKTLKGALLNIYATFVYVSFSILIFLPFLEYILSTFSVGNRSNRIIMIVLWALEISVVYAFLFLLRKAGIKLLSNIRRISQKELIPNRIIRLFLLLTVVSIILLPLPFILTRTATDLLLISISVFHFFLIGFQIAVIFLLYDLNTYQTNLQNMEYSNDTKTAYYNALNKNLLDMQNLRHDVKNLFVTMGNYVNRSDDHEMKEFYQKNIYPYALTQIETNYQFSRLYQIPSETLRSFLYMKLQQGFNLGENISLHIMLDQDTFQYGMDIMDLIRILGIFLDNAFEECEGIMDAQIDFTIRNSKQQISYIIKNNIAPGHRIVKAERGNTSKEGHTGLGIQIAKEIIETYPDVQLNTVYDSKWFQQCINIYL